MLMKLRKIKISDRFKTHPPKDEKLNSRREVFLNHSADFLDLHHPIIVNKDNTLIDGYCTYLVLKEYGVKKFPVIKVGV